MDSISPKNDEHAEITEERLQVLERALRYAAPRRNIPELADAMMAHFGSIPHIITAGKAQLDDFNLTLNARNFFKLVTELMPVYSTESDNMLYTGTESLISLFESVLAGQRTERVMIACFDSEGRLISLETLSKGTVASSAINIRRAAEICLTQEIPVRAAAISHNHPGGIGVPSSADISVTKRIKALLEGLNIDLLDHIIVADDRSYSMRSDEACGVFYSESREIGGKWR